MAKKNSGRKSRRIEHIEQKNRIYIFSEGEKTEPNYFGGFKKLIEDDPIYKDMIEIVPCETNTVKVLEAARQYVKDKGIQRGEIWCVYDKDDFPADAFNAVVGKIERINHKNDDSLRYYAAWSNQCIEYWFILHFSYYTSNNHRTSYIKHLNEEFAKKGLGKYRKNSETIFDILKDQGNPVNAIKYAKRIMKENEGKEPSKIAPGTTVYLLVEDLVKYLPENERKHFVQD